MALRDSYAFFCFMLILTIIFLTPILGLAIAACVQLWWLEYDSDDGIIESYAGLWQFCDNRYLNGTKHTNCTNHWDLDDYSNQGK